MWLVLLQEHGKGVLLISQNYKLSAMHKIQGESFTFTSPEILVIHTLLDAVKEISGLLEHSPVIVLETVNKFGDQQLHLDVHTDQIVEKHLRKNEQVKGFASQERPDYHEIGTGEGYVVTYDPLDGSSIIDTNFSVGSIFSIWHTDEHKLLGTKLEKQANAMIAIYGPRTTVILYNSECKKVQELTLVDDDWILSHENLKVKPKTNMFSPGNLRCASENEAYRQLINGYVLKAYTLRYSGGMVPDIGQIFIKGHGIFTCFGSKSNKAKLRVLYEIACLGWLIEKAGGATMTIGGCSLMEYQVKTYDDRIPFALGSETEVHELARLF